MSYVHIPFNSSLFIVGLFANAVKMAKAASPFISLYPKSISYKHIHIILYVKSPPIPLPRPHGGGGAKV